jgi:UrcA family protein
MQRVSALLALTIGSGLAVAGVDTLSRSTTVPVGDLNLNSAQGVKALYRRISSAAEQVCGPASMSGSRLVEPDYTACVTRAVTEAFAKIGRPELSAQYARLEHSAS